MAKCDNKCGTDLGFFKKGLCPACQKEKTECENAVVILRRLNPPWTYYPEHTWECEDGPTIWGQSVRFHYRTPEGDDAEGDICHEHYSHRWSFSIKINNILLASGRAKQWSCGWTEVLSPFFQSIPAVEAWQRETALAGQEAQLRSQQQERDTEALKKKYGP